MDKQSNKSVLISGASIAGPALAFWLNQYGFDVTIVEVAPALRRGGYKIDIRGKAVDVVKKMGIYEAIRNASAEMISASFINDDGKKIIEMPADSLGMREGDDIELLRGDLSQILYEATRNTCEYIFNDSIKSVRQLDQQVEIDFINGPSRQFDFLVGADGVHSTVRSLVFGDEANFSYDLGDYFYAIYTVENHLNLDRRELFYSKENKLVNIYSTKNSKHAKALFIFRSPGVHYNRRDVSQQKNILLKHYADAGWEVPFLLSAMDKSPDFYFDAAKQIRMDKWSKERTVLVGDAAYSPTLGSGQGTSLALIGSYVLAGELFAAHNYKTAFAEYEKEMRKFVALNQKLGEIVLQQMIPKSHTWLQSLMLKMKSYFSMDNTSLEKLQNQFREAANSIRLKKY